MNVTARACGAVTACALVTGCAYARVSGDLGAGALGPPPSSSPSVSCNNLTDDTSAPVCGPEIQVRRPATAPATVRPTGAFGMTVGGGLRLAPSLYLEPDLVMRAYTSFSGPTATFRDASFPGVAYRAGSLGTAFVFGLPIGLQWRPVPRWSFSAGAGPAVALLFQDFTATPPTGPADTAVWSWTTLDVLTRVSVEYDFTPAPPIPGEVRLKGTVGLTAEADTADLSRAVLVNLSLYVEKAPVRGH
jgi:hypothetical protein